MIADHYSAYKMLGELDNVLLLTHRNPDGDALGSVFGLYRALKNMGKNVRVEVDTVPASLAFLVDGEAFSQFSEDYVVTVDVADIKLLNDDQYNKYADRIYLAIDHHESHRDYSEHLFLDAQAAATCEMICDMLLSASQEISPELADCLYVGIATDTGCFRYSNVTAKTLLSAAALSERGARMGDINRHIFETKSWAYLEFEKLAMNSLKTYFDGKCAVLVITQEMYKAAGVTEGDTQAITALPRQIEGVLAGVVIKEREEGRFKISLRSNEPLWANEICKELGGGGHRYAAGCDVEGTAQQALEQILEVIGRALEAIEGEDKK